MKIIACDFDGTLFQEDGTGISQKDIDAITKFRKSEGLFGIVTGRDLTASQKIIESISPLLDYLICSMGAIICDGGGHIVSQTKSNDIDSIYDIAEFSLKNNVKSFCVINERQRYYFNEHFKKAEDYKSLTEFNNSTVWFNTSEDAQKVEEYIEKFHSEHFTFFRNFECIEITPLGTTKATAVKELAKNLEPANIFAIGDGATDIPMVTEFEGFAVENANPRLKAVAKHQCNHVCDMIDMILL